MMVRRPADALVYALKSAFRLGRSHLLLISAIFDAAVASAGRGCAGLDLSWTWGWLAPSQFVDQAEYSAEQSTRHRHFGHLEDGITGVGNDLGADLDDFFTQGGQGPGFYLLGQGQGAKEVRQIVRQGMELEPDRIGRHRPAGKAGPFQRVLSFLNVLLSRAALIVEGYNLPGLARQVCHDKADTRKEFAGMPFDLDDDPAFTGPGPCLIREAGIIPPNIVRWASDGTLEKMGNAPMQDRVGL